jgi:hypothetical protein
MKKELVCLKWPNSRLAVKLTLQLCLTHGSRVLRSICVVEFYADPIGSPQ